MGTIVDIIELTTKIDTALIKLVVKIPTVFRIDVSKSFVSKTDVSNMVEERGIYNSVNEVEVTLVNVVLS